MYKFSREFRILGDKVADDFQKAILAKIWTGENASLIKEKYRSYTVTVDNDKKPGETKDISVLSEMTFSYDDGFHVALNSDIVSDFLLYIYTLNVLKKHQGDMSIISSVVDTTNRIHTDARTGIQSFHYNQLTSKELLDVIMAMDIQIELNNGALTVLKSFSSYPVKFSGSWLDSSQSGEMRLPFLEHDDMLVGTINSRDLRGEAGIYASSCDASLIPWNCFFNLRIEVDGVKTTTMDYIANHSMKTRSGKPLFIEGKNPGLLEQCLDEIKKIGDFLIPSVVNQGFCTLEIPDGDGGYISATPIMRFQVMTEIANKEGLLKTNVSSLVEIGVDEAFAKELVKGDGKIAFYGFSYASIADNEKRNGLGGNKGMQRIFPQCPYFRKELTAKEKNDYRLNELVKSGKLTISSLFYRPSKDRLESWRKIVYSSNRHSQALAAFGRSVERYIREEFSKEINRLSFEMDWPDKDNLFYKALESISNGLMLKYDFVSQMSWDIALFICRAIGIDNAPVPHDIREYVHRAVQAGLISINRKH